MKQKVKNLFWLLVLFSLSIMGGFLTIFVEQPYTPRTDYLFLLIMGTIITILTVGGISFGIYKLLQRMGIEPAGKNAFRTYGILVLILTLLGFYKFEGALEKRDKYEFMQFFKPELKRIMDQKFEEYPDSVKSKLSTNKSHFERCIEMGIEENMDLIKKLRASSDKKTVIYTDKNFKSIEKECIELYSN